MAKIILEGVFYYSICGLLGSYAVFYLCCAATGCSLRESRHRVIGFLTEWSRVLPIELRERYRKIFGYFGWFLFLILLAYAFNLAGRAIAPHGAATIGYAGNQTTRSWHAKIEAWEPFKIDLRKAYATHEGKTYLDDVEWNQLKTRHGMWRVRVARSLVVFALLYLVASCVDLLVPPRWSRQAALNLAISAAAVAFTLMLWSNYMGDYVEGIGGLAESLGLAAYWQP